MNKNVLDMNWPKMYQIWTDRKCPKHGIKWAKMSKLWNAMAKICTKYELTKNVQNIKWNDQKCPNYEMQWPRINQIRKGPKSPNFERTKNKIDLVVPW